MDIIGRLVVSLDKKQIKVLREACKIIFSTGHCGHKACHKCVLVVAKELSGTALYFPRSDDV
jgi:aerobic-type carbon monoxide dehydrogenase small subunit (CoxS/CutS family)